MPAPSERITTTAANCPIVAAGNKAATGSNDVENALPSMLISSTPPLKPL